ncbi:MAG: hypothetical protein KatS3mg113_0500 [Planctomycetaceae bacterium]|nr:MAG: hypothetical protein KatS3mg113_0500 [Planctomycetaceae bacterium]
MSRHRYCQIGTACSLAVAAMLLAGCGGGASATPVVKYLPSRPGGEQTSSSPASTADNTTEVTSPSSGSGILKGRVVVVGNWQPLSPLYPKGGAPKDNEVCGVEAIPDETVIVNDGGLANVFVYLTKAPAGADLTPPQEPVIFDQKYCVFLPHALIVRTGQVVKVLNDDGALHNTHTYPQRNPVFNQGVKPNDRAGVDLVYSRPENLPLMVGCDVHPWMKAYHLPLDHPFGAVTQSDGRFEIPNLPAGKHSFRVWHEKAGEIQRNLAVTIKPGETTEVEVTVNVSQLAQTPARVPEVRLALGAAMSSTRFNLQTYNGSQAHKTLP